MGGKEWQKMSPENNDLFWKWKAIYEELLDPFTETVTDKYFSPILETQLNYCKKMGIPISIAILDITNLSNSPDSTMTLETYLLIRKISNKIRARLTTKDMVFYNGGQTFLFILPKADKDETHKLIENIGMDIGHIYQRNIPLTVKGGYAEYPSDADNHIKLQECTKQAVGLANQSSNNRIIGYFTERRKDTRVPLEVEVRYISSNSPERLTCSRNISESGIMLSGLPDLALGEEIKLIFSLPKTIRPKMSISAKTVWNKVNTKTGKIDIGLCFTSINNDTKEQIRRFASNVIPPIVNL